MTAAGPRSSVRRRVALTLDGEDPVLGRAVGLAIIALILVSTAALTFETVRGLPDWLYTLFHVIEVVVLVCFSVEYLLRIWAAERPLAYIFSFWGVIDLLAILPALALVGADSLVLRIVRILRLLRLLKLVRYARAAKRLRLAFEDIRDELALFAIVSPMVFFICAAGIHFFEHEAQPEAFGSIPASLWWAVATLTTVGYGDVYPVTAGGRIFTAIVLILGLGIVAVPTGLVASALTRQPNPGEDEDTEEDTQ